MVDKLEAAARAICKARNLDPDTCVEGSGGASADGVAFAVCHKRRWEWYLADASAAINAATVSTSTEDARERIAALEEALKPFARTDVLEPNGVILGLERWHFDRARRVLSTKEDQHG